MSNITLSTSISTSMPDAISSGTKQQSNSPNFVEALNKTTPNLTRENPQTQETIKNEQPTQHISKETPKETSQNKNTNEDVEPIDSQNIQPLEETRDQNPPNQIVVTEFISSATLLTDVPLIEISNTENVHEISDAQESDKINLLPLEIDEIGIRLNITPPVTESTEKEIPEVQIELPEDENTEVKKAAELPELVVSSEVHELLPIETPKVIQNVKVEQFTTQNNTTLETSVLSYTKTKQTYQNVEEDGVKEVKQPVLEMEAPIQTMQQAVFTSAEAKIHDKREDDIRDNKANNLLSKQEKAMVDSVTIETIATNTENSNPEMSLELGNEENEGIFKSDRIKFDDMVQDFKPIDHTTKLTSVASTPESNDIEIPEMHSIPKQINSAVHKLTSSDLGAKRITITLTPESLGKVEIRLNTEAGRINSIEIKAAKHETLQLLETNAKILQETLKEVNSGNEANLGFGFLDKGSDSEKQKQQTSPLQEFSLLNPNSSESEGTSPVRTLSDFSR